MLQLPSVMFYRDAEIPDFTAIVYGDDADPAKFFAVSATPEVRKDAEGFPVFKLIKYGFDNDALAEDEGLPAGGGYLQMDVALDIPADVEERLLAALVPLVPAPDDPAEPPPPPRLAVPEFTKGRVRFFTVADPALIGTGGGAEAGNPEAPTRTGQAVRGILAEGTPDLIGSNVAGVTATLTPAGATFFQKTMVGENGQPVDGLLPVRVEYDLTFLARLPPIRAYVHAEKSLFHREFDSIRHDFEGRGCDEDVRRTTELHWETLRRSEVIESDFDRGTLPADDPAVVEMRTFVMSRVAEWTQNAILEPVPDTDPAFPDTDDIYASSDDVYRYRSEVNSQTADLHIDLQERAIGEKRLHPNASLRPIFGELTPAEMERFVQEIDLDDEFFSKVVVEPVVRVNWDEQTISRVSLILAYDGEEREFDFTRPVGDDPAAERARVVFDRVDSQRDYEYRYVVQYTDPAAADFTSPTFTGRAKDLAVIPRERGYAEVGIHVPDFSDSLDQMLLELTYRSPRGQEFTFAEVFTNEGTEKHWRVPIAGAIDGVVTGTATWRLKDGFEVSEDIEVGDDLHVVVLPPSLPKVSCAVLVPDSDAIENIFLTLKPDLPNGIERPIRRSGDDVDVTLVQHDFYVREGTPRRWRYRYTIDPKGSIAPAQSGPGIGGGWSEPIDSGETVEVRWDAGLAEAAKTLRASAARLVGRGFVAATLVVRHQSPAGSGRFDHTFVFDGTDKPVDAEFRITLPGNDWKDFKYEWEAELFHTSEPDRKVTGQGTSMFLMLPVGQ